ncbi:ectoine/hydroxyectoine ABC transporter substrate-binding protein EhuB [Actinocorallia populi]|uniref:ectoine/hydroxyectoine ABC transporter substrate-binding protein EhuB n=1 Tax=Actinocorallia populi TaxID=2079200 RepID=UPI0022B7E8AE|nr:ectoine/hydroxyectoine ABC transporter substrate-binding protein EhuB [Actinocorallia populi]
MSQGWTRRGFLGRTATAGVVALAGSLVLSACSSTDTAEGDTLAKAKEAGTIKVGFANEAPYGFTDANGELTGQAPAVARAVFEKLGVPKIEGVLSGFDGLIQGLSAGQFDVVAAGMFINPERCANAAFSIPDYTTKSAFLVADGNPKGVKTFEEIKSSKASLAVLSGAVEKGYATDAGVPEDQIQTFDTQDNLLRAVNDGRVDAAALTDISLNDLVSKNPDSKVEVTPGFTPVSGGEPVVSAGAFVFRKGDDTIREAFNAELKKLHENGEWVELVEPFGFGEQNVPGPEVTTESLCQG